jgi:hypothetical protein
MQVTIKQQAAEIERKGIEVMMALSKQQDLAIACEQLRAERDAALAEIERLKADIQTHQRSFAALKSDTDALQAKLAAMEAVDQP